MPAYAAQASHPDVVEASLDLMPQGNAVDAVVAGVLAAAAVWPSVLLGPVQMLLGGAGVGERAVDGRPRQPGRGAQRPRGFLPGQPVPGAARVAVPALPAALAAAVATAGSVTWSRVMGPAVEIAKARSDERQRFLKRLGQVGPSYLADRAVAQELTAAAGRVEGGLVTVEDLEAVRPEVVAAEVVTGAAAPFVAVPWGARALVEENAPADDGSHTAIVAAADGRGLVAIACFEIRPDTLPVPELGLEAPFFAAPVLRGETRVRPGEPRAAAAPITLLHADGTLDTALGLVATRDAERLLGRVCRSFMPGSSLEEALAAPRSRAAGEPEGLVVGVVRGKRGARALGDPRRMASDGAHQA